MPLSTEATLTETINSLLLPLKKILVKKSADLRQKNKIVKNEINIILAESMHFYCSKT